MIRAIALADGRELSFRRAGRGAGAAESSISVTRFGATARWDWNASSMPAEQGSTRKLSASPSITTSRSLCTPDHLFMLRDGTYKRADQLHCPGFAADAPARWPGSTSWHIPSVATRVGPGTGRALRSGPSKPSSITTTRSFPWNDSRSEWTFTMPRFPGRTTSGWLAASSSTTAPSRAQQQDPGRLASARQNPQLRGTDAQQGAGQRRAERPGVGHRHRGRREVRPRADCATARSSC